MIYSHPKLVHIKRFHLNTQVYFFQVIYFRLCHFYFLNIRNLLGVVDVVVDAIDVLTEILKIIINYIVQLVWYFIYYLRCLLYIFPLF
jgi:hypothetical protein